MEYYSTIKRSKLLIPAKIWPDLRGHYAEWKNPISNHHRLHNPIYVTSQNDKITVAEEDRLVNARSYVKGEV